MAVQQVTVTSSMEEARRNMVTDREIMLTSPVSSSVASTPQSYHLMKKEAVQVFVRVRPPFTHEVDEEASRQYSQYDGHDHS
jgi:hypothetical protein